MAVESLKSRSKRIQGFMSQQRDIEKALGMAPGMGTVGISGSPERQRLLRDRQALRDAQVEERKYMGGTPGAIEPPSEFDRVKSVRGSVGRLETFKTKHSPPAPGAETPWGREWICQEVAPKVTTTSEEGSHGRNLDMKVAHGRRKPMKMGPETPHGRDWGM